MSELLKNRFKWALIYTLIVLVINAIIPSHSNGFKRFYNDSEYSLIDNSEADRTVEMRTSVAAFKRRPVVTTIQNYLKQSVGVPYQLSFNLINYISLFTFLICMTFVSDNLWGRYSTKSRDLIIGVTLTMPILFAFCGSIHTYDDFLQYLVISVYLIAVLRGKIGVAAVLLGLGCIIRETTALAGLAGTAILIIRGHQRWSAIIHLFIGIAIYALFLTGYLDDESQARTIKALSERRFNAWRYNFMDSQWARQAITSGYLVMGLPLAILFKHEKEIRQRYEGFWRIALALLIFNTLLVYVAALARETRLFFLPLIFILPLVQVYLLNEVEAAIGKLRQIRFGLICVIISALFSFVFYYTREGGTGIVFHIYCFFYTLVFLSVVAPYHSSKLSERE